MSNSLQESNDIPYEFGKKPFPSQVDGKLNTLEFLEASKGVVCLISKLGTVFSPLYGDISRNIEKIKQCHQKDPKSCENIEELVSCNNASIKAVSVDALLWLQRALHFTLVFFQNILNDAKRSENLEGHMSSAYSETLEPHHGWVTRKLFQFFKNLMPKRSDLLLKISGKETEVDKEKEDEIESVLKFLEIYFRGLSENIYYIKSILERVDVDANRKE